MDKICDYAIYNILPNINVSFIIYKDIDSVEDIYQFIANECFKTVVKDKAELKNKKNEFIATLVTQHTSELQQFIKKHNIYIVKTAEELNKVKSNSHERIAFLKRIYKKAVTKVLPLFLESLDNGNEYIDQILTLTDEKLVNWFIDHKIISFDMELQTDVAYKFVQSANKYIIFRLSAEEFFKYLSSNTQASLMKWLRNSLKELQKDNSVHTLNDKRLKELKPGDTISLHDAGEFHYLTHNDKVTPLVYINGNIIPGTSHGNMRDFHYALFEQYKHDMSLHKNDIIKLTEEEWEQESKLSLETFIKKYNGVSATSDKNVITLIGVPSAIQDTVAKAFYDFAHIPVLTITDDASAIQCLQAKKRLMKKIIG